VKDLVATDAEEISDENTLGKGQMAYVLLTVESPAPDKGGVFARHAQEWPTGITSESELDAFMVKVRGRIAEAIDRLPWTGSQVVKVDVAVLYGGD
jgi:hypothetical protein